MRTFLILLILVSTATAATDALDERQSSASRWLCRVETARRLGGVLYLREAMEVCWRRMGQGAR